MFKIKYAIALASWLVTMSLLTVAMAADGPKLPAGFDSAKLSEGLNSTSLVILPDGRVLIAEKHGAVRVVKNDVLLPQPLVTLRNVETNDEHGLDGMAVHPQFAANGYVYLFYTVRSGQERGLYNRICRHIVRGDVAIGKETVIFETDRAENIHNGGAMCFGPDGKLYIGSGEVTAGDQWIVNMDDRGRVPAKR